MILAKVKGPVVSTHKHQTLRGQKLLTVAPINTEGEEIAPPFIAVDTFSAGPGDLVLVIKEGKGACRDLTWLYLTSCRSVGLAARFISGYHLPFNVRKKPELHAWCEVFLPGAGWLGFDPNLGMAISERHVAVATSFNPVMTLPTSGTFWGKDSKSNLKANISIHTLE